MFDVLSAVGTKRRRRRRRRRRRKKFSWHESCIISCVSFFRSQFSMSWVPLTPKGGGGGGGIRGCF